MKRGEAFSLFGRLGKDFHRKGNPVKRFGAFSELPESEKCIFLGSSRSRKSANFVDR